MFKLVTISVAITTLSLLEPGLSHETESEYNYEVEVHDPHTGGVSTLKEGRQGGVTHGGYTVVDKDGSSRRVEYKIGGRKSHHGSPGYPSDEVDRSSHPGNLGLHAEFRPSQPLTGKINTFRPIISPSQYDLGALHYQTEPHQGHLLHGIPSFHHAEPAQHAIPLHPIVYHQAEPFHILHPEHQPHQVLLHPNNHLEAGFPSLIGPGKARSYSNYIDGGKFPPGHNYGGKTLSGQSSLGYHYSKPSSLTEYRNKDVESLAAEALQELAGIPKPDYVPPQQDIFPQYRTQIQHQQNLNIPNSNSENCQDPSHLGLGQTFQSGQHGYGVATSHYKYHTHGHDIKTLTKHVIPSKYHPGH